MTETDQRTFVDHKKPVHGRITDHVWWASWINVDNWEGSDDVYADEESAFRILAAQYVRDEYAWDDTAPHDEAPDCILEWRKSGNGWALYDKGERTGVRLHKTAVVETGGHATGCQSTIHCVHYGFCHRCSPELADAGSHVMNALLQVGLHRSGKVYGEMMALLMSHAGPPGAVPGAAKE
jgi:hypothetical protein